MKKCNMDTVEPKQVVVTTLTRKGRGVAGSPIRMITQVWNQDGSGCIAEHDPYSLSVEQATACIMAMQEKGSFQRKLTSEEVGALLMGLSKKL